MLGHQLKLNKRKKLLMVSMFFDDRKTVFGKNVSELAFYLSRHGYSIRQVTASPKMDEFIEVGPGISRYPNSLIDLKVFHDLLPGRKQLAEGYSIGQSLAFAIASLPVILRQIFWKPDIILCFSPSIFSAPIALGLARLCGARAWIHLQSSEVEVLELRKGLCAWLCRFEEATLRAFDQVSVATASLGIYVLHRRVQPEKIMVLPLWIDAESVRIASKQTTQEEFGNSRPVSIVCHTNSNGKRKLGPMLEIAERLQDEPGLEFLLYGEKIVEPEMANRIQALPNVRYLGLKSLTSLNRMADIHWFISAGDPLGVEMAGRLAHALSAGRAVVTTASEESEIGRLVARIGKRLDMQDLIGLANALLRLAQSRVERERLGLLARQYALERWGDDLVMDCFNRYLTYCWKSA